MANKYFNWPGSLRRFVRFDAARSEDVNDALDEVSTAMDGVETDTKRSIKLPASGTDQLLDMAPEQRANLVIGFDPSGAIAALPGGGRFAGDWAAGTAYLVSETFRDPVTKNLYSTALAHTSATIADDLAASKIRLAINVVDVELAKDAAAASAGVAAGHATGAAGSAATATVQADLAMGYRNTAGLHAATATDQAAQAASDAAAALGYRNTAQTAAGTATTEANRACSEADRAELAAAGIAGGPVTSVNGKTGVVELSFASLQGDPAPYVTQTKTYQITNYNSFSAYSVAASAGTASLAGDTITFTAPVTAGNVSLTLTVDSQPTVFAITVQAAGVAKPTNTSPADGAVNIGASPVLQSSAFATYGLADTHLASRWTLYQGGTQVHSSGWRTDALTSYAVPAGVVAVALPYTWTVEHQGTTLGNSQPSTATSFSTAASFGGAVGTQGGQGFGVGEYPGGTLPTGFSAMAGTGDKASANYGNYTYTDGSVMVFVPKFYYRIGHASSPRFATYGANAIDVVGIETFANEAAANAAGYALHRAFKDGGAVKSGFFVDKYLASKNGTTSCKSIANADPISLTTNASYNPSSGMTGCTGILADAVVLARARGAGVFNVASIFMYDAIAKLSLAHGQAAAGTANCAWYDAAGTTNFPKGCNNGALADVNDTGVTYAVSTASPKPKTRATAGFAKTTHNGQECGVADVNGSMYQAMLGLTMAGTSATDAVANGAGNAYVLKESTALASLTGGWGGATDAWGTGANLATRYDLANGFFPWAGTTGWEYFGNGPSAVFSGATSGTDYLRSCSGIGAVTGMSAAGTNQFGADGNYRSGPANLFPMASGVWVSAADAGVFCRFWGFHRSDDYSSVGFRAAAYGN